jgi:glycosyltransferase involved in cell wall biosynthesis
MNKKIYILLATYNGEKFIGEQIDSLLNQTYQNWKLIIHDDNSKDNTIKLIKEYEDKHPNKIKFINDGISTGGAKQNFTYLLNNIDNNYDYIMFCDQDDVWMKEKIEITLNKMLEVEAKCIRKPILIHTDLKVVDDQLNIISNSMFKYQKLNLNNQDNIERISIENIVTGCTMMLNKKLVMLSKTIPEEAIMHDWWIAITTLKCNGIIEFVDNSTILYRQHELNTIGSKKINLIFYVKKIINFNFFTEYRKIYKQYVMAEVRLNKYKFFILKFIFIINKIFKK